MKLQSELSRSAQRATPAAICAVILPAFRGKIRPKRDFHLINALSVTRLDGAQPACRTVLGAAYLSLIFVTGNATPSFTCYASADFPDDHDRMVKLAGCVARLSTT